MIFLYFLTWIYITLVCKVYILYNFKHVLIGAIRDGSSGKKDGGRGGGAMTILTNFIDFLTE